MVRSEPSWGATTLYVDPSHWHLPLDLQLASEELMSTHGAAIRSGRPFALMKPGGPSAWWSSAVLSSSRSYKRAPTEVIRLNLSDAADSVQGVRNPMQQYRCSTTRPNEDE